MSMSLHVNILVKLLTMFSVVSLNIQAYGGGGSASSSSFIIRMDEYNQWLSVNASRWSKGMMHHFEKY